ncbi:MAG: fumarate reductase subunit C [Armatimonadetes bacterium]|nr:fumarate reductase subunit C [Armatimonadota bacterium]
MQIAPKTKVKEYRRPAPSDWWLKKPSYTRYMLREFCGVLLGGYAVVLLLVLRAARDAGQFRALLDGLKSPVSVLIHLVFLAAALYHAYTYVKLTPRVLVVKQGEERVPGSKIEAAHYVGIAVASLVLLGLFLAAR